MKISGFTFVRNGVSLHYPFVESIRSLLPLVDELIVNVPESDDRTLEAVRAIDDSRLIVFESDWDNSLREGGRILSLQSNRALERCSGDWAIYLQADEVLHENDYPSIRDAIQRYLDADIQGLSFRYLHFEGGYRYVNPFRYRRQVRVVRTGCGVRSTGDACGFERVGGKFRIADSGARVFHYGWARLPDEMMQKNRELEKLYHDDGYIKRNYGNRNTHEFRDIDVCRPFQGTHPAVMKEIIATAPPGPKPGNVPYFLRSRVWYRLFKKWGLLR